MHDRIFIIAPVSSLRRRVRLAKLTRMLLGDGFHVRHLGWERVPGEMADGAWPDTRVSAKALVRGGGYANVGVKVRYVLWAVRVFFAILRVRRNSLCFCLGWETAFPAVLASTLSGARIVFDDADRFSMFVKLPGVVSRAVERCERWTADRSHLHIVPGLLQYEWRSENMFLLRNAALAEDYSAAKRSPRHRPQHQLVLYMNGWIANDTGVGVVIDALGRLNRDGVDYLLYVAGNVVAEEGGRLLQNPRVRFLGQLSQLEALEYYSASDVVLTLYDPAIAINHYAGSNKWADCIALGKPFIVNREVLSAAEFLASGAAFGFSYADSDELARLLRALAENPGFLATAEAALPKHFDYAQSYEQQYRGLRSRLFGVQCDDTR